MKNWLTLKKQQQHDSKHCSIIYNKGMSLIRSPFRVVKGSRTSSVSLRRFTKFKAQKSSKENEGMLTEKIQNLDDEGKS